jgi:hypothetical protein
VLPPDRGQQKDDSNDTGKDASEAQESQERAVPHWGRHDTDDDTLTAGLP